MTQPQTDRLVEDYLGAVSYACADLPRGRRDDLIADLREHIAAAREVLYQPTEAAIRTILERLGEPSAIAEEARLGEPLSQHTAPPPPPAPPVEPYRRSPTGVLGMVLGFVLVIIVILVLGTVLMLGSAPAP
jgi:uncharacterized membrane protein